MRLLVCGGRDFQNRDAVFQALDLVHAQQPIRLVIHGACIGADLLGDQWATERGILRLPFPADWNAVDDPTQAQNQRMLELGLPDGVLAFPGQGRTADMIRRAVSAGLKVWRPYG